MANQLLKLIAAGLAASNCAFANYAFAGTDDSPDWGAETLTGDWGGARSGLFSKGIDVEFTHKSDVMADISGGIKRGTVWMGHTEARIKMDLDRLWGWDSTTGYIHFHSQLGSKFNRDYVGSYVGVDSIEASVNTAQYSHVWLQKSFSDEDFSVLAGIYSIDSEFYVTDTSGVFMQPPCGIGDELAQSGRNGPPIFPIGALAMRMKYTTPGQNFYLQSALTDGVPGDPNNLYGTHIKLGNGDGTFLIAEFGYTPQQSEPHLKLDQPGELTEPEQKVHEAHESFNKTAIGLWRYSASFNDLTSSELHPSRGIYILAERTLAVEKEHASRGLSGFVRFGTATKEINQADWTGSLGLRYHGLIASRGDDISGIAVAVSHASDKYRLANNQAESSQTDVEATYRAQINPWLALQPTLQYVANPNMNRTLGNAWVVGARFELAL